MTKRQWAEIAKELGAPNIDQSWGEFAEFKALVEASAIALGIPQPSPQFSRFGLAMLDAKTLGEFEVLDHQVTP